MEAQNILANCVNLLVPLAEAALLTIVFPALEAHISAMVPLNV